MSKASMPILVPVEEAFLLPVQSTRSVCGAGRQAVGLPDGDAAGARRPRRSRRRGAPPSSTTRAMPMLAAVEVMSLMWVPVKVRYALPVPVSEIQLPPERRPLAAVDQGPL